MKSRRGISSVVGTVFAVIALSTTIGYITYSMTTLDTYNQTVLSRTQQTVDIANEKFEVSNATFYNNKLAITAVNTGTIPINFTKLWVTNTTDPNGLWIKNYVPKTAVVTPGAILTNIGQNVCASCVFYQTMGYHIKLVTSRGNSQEFNLNTGTSKPLFAQTSVLPQAVVPGYQVVVLFTITNNQTGNNIILNLTPSMTGAISGVISDATLMSGPTPASYPSLMPGSSVTFKWAYAINGKAGDKVTFSPYLVSVPAVTASDTVTLQFVAFAGTSLNALSANGLGSQGPNDAVLFLHQEQAYVPAGANNYQMYSGQADNSTLKVIQIDTTSPSFYTNTDSTPDISLPAGRYNATLRYMSSPVPHTFTSAQYPSLIYHFEDGLNPASIKDSSANTYTLSVSASKPTSTSGVNGSLAYSYSGSSQYFYRALGGTDSVAGFSNAIATAAGWFKTNGAVSGKQDIFHIGDTPSKPFFEVAIDYGSGNNGKLILNYSGTSTGSSPIICRSSSAVDNSQWHYFVAVRTAAGSCSIYVDSQTPITNSPGCSSCTGFYAQGNYVIGAEKVTSPSRAFKGWIDDIMYWNNYAVTAAQALDLLKTSYGTNAQTLHFTISITDSSGGSPQIVNDTANYPMPFADSFGDYASSPPASSTHWGKFNFTTAPYITLTGTKSIPSTDRLKFQIQYVTPANGREDMVMIIDNTGLSGGSSGNSFLQIPSPSSILPGYFIYVNTGDGTVSVFDAGPNRAWLTSNSRVVFEDPNGGQDYASWVGNYPTSGCGGGTCYAIDTTLLSAGTTTQLQFTKPCTSPGPDSASAGTKIPPGTYRLFVYLNGYDQEGNFLATSQYVGPVKVTGNTGIACPPGNN